MSDLGTSLERIAEAGVAGIALLPLRSPRARGRARARRLGAALVGICILVAAVAVAVSVRSPNQPDVPRPAQGGSGLVADASYEVPSSGMAPTLEIGDVVSGATHFGTIERGDVVRVRLPNDSGVATPPGGEAGFKRVVGLPGETVEDRNGWVFIDGQELREPYVSALTSVFPRTLIPPGSYFLLGDNRENSKDSRHWGPVHRSEIIAIALRITSPLARSGAISGSPRSKTG